MISILYEYWPVFLGGLLVTLELSALAILFSVMGGSLVGIIRHYGGRTLNLILGLFVDVLRSIPLLVVLIWIFLASPTFIGITYLDPFVAAVIGLSLVQGAYISEIVRGGIKSVRSQQTRAGLALGMKKSQVVTRVVFPQAFIRMLPPIGSQVAITIKDSTIASVIAVPELLRQSQIVVGATFQPFAILTTLMVFYFFLVIVVIRLIDFGYSKVSARGAS